MTKADHQSRPAPPANGNVWLTIAVILVLAVIGWWQNQNASKPAGNVADSGAVVDSSPDDGNRESPQPSETGDRSGQRPGPPHPDQDDPTVVDHSPDHQPASDPVGFHDPKPNESRPKRLAKSGRSTTSHDNTVDHYKIENQSIRDLDGRVVFKGTIDLGPTLSRIKRGESNRHRNDGTTFQNREGRLPRKPSGYYKEYVQPTPGINGPGPQRLILGEQGEIWYTPDHYKTFKQIEP